jgi:peptidoglycan hydrolase CwlO-like protein
LKSFSSLRPLITSKLINEIINVIRSVLKEEFEPVHKRLGDIDQDVKYLKTGQTMLREDVNELKASQTKLGNDVNELKSGQTKLGNDENELKAGQIKLGNGVIELITGQTELGHKAVMLEQAINELKNEQKENYKSVIRYLGDYSEKITNHFDNKTDALNKRVFAVETELQRLIKQ